MQKNLLGNRLSRWLMTIVVAVLATLNAQAQLAGTKTIPGSYPSLAAAIIDLNTQGVGAGGVTFSIAAGYTETFASPTAGAITATGTAANPIVFQKSGTGANPLITAGVGTTTTVDAIISLAGSDYVTLDGLSVAESAANTTATTQMEFGIALFRASATDGSQFNSIRNCVVTLNKTNTGTIGIYGASSASATAVTATAPTGANSSNKVYSNVVTNAMTGIYFAAGSLTAIANYDQSNEIGVTAGNTIGNFGGSATAYGAGGNYQNGLKVTGNTINSTLDYTSATASTPVLASTVTSTLRGVYAPNGTSSNIDITNNTITLASGATTSQVSGIENATGGTAASNTVNITGNTVQITYGTATTATIYGIYNTATAATVNITGNTVQNVTAPAATTLVFTAIASSTGSALNISGNSVLNNVIPGTGTMTLISSTVISATALVAITNNILTGNSKTPAGTTVGASLIGITLGTAATTITGNTITNNTLVTSGTSTTVGTLIGITSTASSTPSEMLSNNTITGLSISGTSTATTHVLRGIVTAANGTGDVQTLVQNTVGGLAIASGGGTVTGIYIPTGGGPGSTVSRNKIYDLSATGATGIAIGINVVAGGTYLVSNNLIGSLTAPAATGLNAVVGLYVTAGTATNAYFNTIYLNASSTGATFGTSGIYLGSTSTALDVRNNIVVNKSTAAGTGGYTAALRRVSGTAGTIPANLVATSNNNLYYAGTPAATNLIYVEGTTTATNAQQTLATYKAFVAARETNSVTEDVSFLSTTGTAATFLHISPTVATQVESAGTPVSGITTDFDGDTRNATSPDIGADEGTFLPLDLTPPVITFTALPGTSSTANRTLTATITDFSGIATGTGAPRIYYRKGTSGTFFSAVATTVSGSTYTFTIDYASIGGATTGDVIQYYVAAQDASVNNNVATSPAGGTGTNPPGSTGPGTVNQYTILTGLSGIYYVGTSTSPNPARTYATLTAAANAYSTSGLDGAVTFLLLDPSYSATTGETFPIAFFNHADASAAKTLTISPNAGVSATVTAAGSVLALASSRYITIDGSNTAGGTTRNLTLNNTVLTANTYVLGMLSQTGQAQANQFATVRNVNIVGGGATTNATLGIVLAGADNDNVTLQNNSVLGVTTGIQAAGTTLVSVGGLDNLVLTGNVVGPVTATTGSNINSTGILVSNAIAPAVTGNTVQNVTSAAALTALQVQNATSPTITGNSILNIVSTGSTVYGLSSFATTGATISQNLVQNITGNSSLNLSAGLLLASGTTGAVADRNRLLNLTEVNTSGNGMKGIEVQTGLANANVRISNNFVQVTAGSGYSGTTFSNLGIRLSGTQSGINIYYNSVNMTGTDVLNIASVSAGLAVVSGSTGLDVRNNIFRNSIVNSGNAGAKAYALYSTAPASAFTNINYNDYFVSGTQAVLAYFNADVATLAALRSATAGTGQDANSISADPLFVSTTDLHASAVALDAVATPIASVTTDIDGDVRNATTPDIGADEFTPLTNDLAAAALVAPTTTNTCYGTAEPVSVSIRNAGTAVLNFATNAATVTVVVTLPGGGTQTFTTTVNTGTLPSNATQTVTLPTTLNMTAVGTYTFAITATVVGDGNTNNDLLAPAPTRTVAAPVAGTLAPAASSICVSGTATLTLTGAANGAIQFQSSPDNVTFTDIAGATSATYTTPVLTTTAYYRAQVRCNTGTATSNVSTITVNNPLVATTNTPVAICSGSTATLTATASAGSSVRFFSTATGGTALTSTTAGSYTTPALTAGTTYYAEAYSGGSETVGRATPSVTTGFIGANYGLVFNTTSAVTIQSAVIYPIGTGTVTFALVNSAGTELAATSALSVTGTGATTPVTVALNLAVPAAGTDYRLIVKAYTGITDLLRENPLPTGSAFPFTSPSGLLSLTAGYLAGTVSTGAYYYFYNIAISNECVGGATRTPIQVNVTQPATASFPAATASTCGSTPYQLAGTVAGSATTGTYTTSGTGTFSPNATTLSATYTPSAADITAGSVTITLTSTAAPCAPTTAMLALSIGRPAVATFSYPAATTYCAGSTSTVTPTLATGATAGAFTSTTGLTINATTGVITLSSSTAGTYTVTNTVAASGACAAVTATTTVTVTPAASAAFSYAAASFCQTGTNPTPTVTGTAGGTFSSTPGLNINATTGLITLSTSTAGTYTVTYTVAGACGSSATASVAITTGQAATFSYPATGGNCAGSTGTVAPTLATGATAGTFTSTTGLTINATTGVVNLATSTAGNYTVTNTVAASGSCAAATATATITVNPTPARPTLTPSYNGTVTTLTSSSATGNQYYFNGVAITGATGQTYVVNGSVTTYGSYTVVVTNSFGCSSQASVATVVTTTRQGIVGASIQLYPNPTPDGRVTLALSGLRSATQLAVIDALGRVVSSELLPATTGVVNHSLDLSRMASGVYMLRLTNTDGVETRRLTRE